MLPLSVLLPVRNGMPYLARAQASLVENCESYDEIIVINDGSTDGSSEFIKEWAKTEPRLRVIAGEAKGLVHALNAGIAASQHSWLARVDVDDQYAPNRLKVQRKLIAEGVVAIFSDYQVLAEDGKNLGTIASPVHYAATSISLVNSQRTAHPSVLLQKKAVLAVGGYRPQDFPVEDLSLWLRLSRVGKLISAPQTLLKYQLTPGSITALKQEEMVNKKREVIFQIGINPTDLEEVTRNWKGIFKSYSGTQLGNQRKILLTRDLYSAYKASSKASPALFLFMACLLLIDPKTYVSVFVMQIEKTRRSAAKSYK